MSERTNRKRLHKKRSKLLGRTRVLEIVCGVIALVLIIKLFDLQIVKHDVYEAAAVEQQMQESTVMAKRGTIYDSNMNILAMSATVYNVYLSPAEISRYDEDKRAEELEKAEEEDEDSEDEETLTVSEQVAVSLRDILGLDYNEVYNTMENARSAAEQIASVMSEILGLDYSELMDITKKTDSWYSIIAKKVTNEQSDAVQAFIDATGYQGVHLEETSQRYYPYSTLACHVIGYVGGDEHGVSGVEYYYDDVLSGTDGRIVSMVNAAGSEIKYTGADDIYDAQDGQSLVLTINENVQYSLEEHLEEAVESYDLLDGAAGIVMDVNTGAILAMASLGNFDLNDYAAVSVEAQEEIDAEEDETLKEELLAAAREEQWTNKALTETYEPGSTFKIITLASALESGAITVDDTFYCGGSINVLGRDDPLNCWQTSGHGTETLTQAAMNSCNVAFVTIGQKIGAERFYDYIRAFGLFEKTGVDLAGESGSIWWDEDVFTDKYNLSQLAAASFGQTFTITPLQLITAVSAVANGGYLMTPYVVSQVLDSDGNVVSQTEPHVVRQVISEETSEECCEILEQVVGNSAGTGSNAYVAGYRIAGKTGTSEDVVYETETGEKKYIVSFIGFAPADDPQVAVLVLLENPGPDASTYVSGGQMAAPTVGSIMADILPMLGVETEYSEEENAIVDRSVPRLVGDSLADAQAELDDLGFTYQVIGDGSEVTAQLPKANSTIAGGSEVVLYCGTEPGAEAVEMLDLIGLDYETARIRMGWSGLYINGEGALLSSNSYITAQSVEPGEEVAAGTVVTVTLTDSSRLGRY